MFTKTILFSTEGCLAGALCVPEGISVGVRVYCLCKRIVKSERRVVFLDDRSDWFFKNVEQNSDGCGRLRFSSSAQKSLKEILR